VTKCACQIAEDLFQGGPEDTVLKLDLGNTLLFRRTNPSEIECMIYRPLACFILQGAKVVQSGDIAVNCPTGYSVIVSHELPVQSQIIEATPDKPYIALILPLDIGLLRGFYEEMSDFVDTDSQVEALLSIPCDRALADVIDRFLAIISDGQCISLLGPIILKELHARLMLSPQGAILRRFLRRDDPSNHVAKAISSIRDNISAPLSIPALAERAGMSRSSFHAHFKSITGFTPGQYQKDIRLLEAHRLLNDTSIKITVIAFEVGYESPSQFSRDYAAKFGQSPRKARKMVSYNSGILA